MEKARLKYNQTDHSHIIIEIDKCGLSPVSKYRAVAINTRSKKRLILGHYSNLEKALDLSDKRLEKLLKNPPAEFTKFIEG